MKEHVEHSVVSNSADAGSDSIEHQTASSHQTVLTVAAADTASDDSDDS